MPLEALAFVIIFEETIIVARHEYVFHRHCIVYTLEQVEMSVLCNDPAQVVRRETKAITLVEDWSCLISYLATCAADGLAVYGFAIVMDSK